MSRVSGWSGALGHVLSPDRAEFLRFAAVGGATYVIDTVVFLALKTTVLEEKPITAKAVAVVVATVASYLLNRGWSFRARRRHRVGREVVGYGLVAGGALLLAAAPLAVSRYVLDLATPTVSESTEQIADLVSAQILGTALAMAFRWWAFRRWIFPAEASATTIDRPEGPGFPDRTGAHRRSTGGT